MEKSYSLRKLTRVAKAKRRKDAVKRGKADKIFKKATVQIKMY